MILLILTAFSLNLVFNLTSILDIGHYRLNDLDRIEFEDNKMDVQYLTDLTYNHRLGVYDGIFLVNYSLDEDLDVLGLSSIDFEITVDNETIIIDKCEFSEPKRFYYETFHSKLESGDKLIITGNSKFSLNNSGEPKVINSDFHIEFVMKINSWEYFYQFEIGRLWLEILLVICFISLSIFLCKAIKDLYFQKKLPLREKLRSDAYFEYIKEEAKRKRRENF